MKSTLKSVVVGLVVVCLMAGCPSKKKSQRDKTLCQANVRTVWMEVALYELRHGGEFPDTLTQSHRALSQEIGVVTVGSLVHFVCPSTGRRPGDPDSIDEWSDYVYVKPQRWARKGEPAKLLIYERQGNHPDGRHELYTDGTVKWVPNPLSGLRAFPSAPQLPTEKYQEVLEVDVKVPQQGDFWLPDEYQRMLEEKIREMQEKEGS